MAILSGFETGRLPSKGKHYDSAIGIGNGNCVMFFLYLESTPAQFVRRFSDVTYREYNRGFASGVSAWSSTLSPELPATYILFPSAPALLNPSLPV